MKADEGSRKSLVSSLVRIPPPLVSAVTTPATQTSSSSSFVSSGFVKKVVKGEAQEIKWVETGSVLLYSRESIWYLLYSGRIVLLCSADHWSTFSCGFILGIAVYTTPCHSILHPAILYCTLAIYTVPCHSILQPAILYCTLAIYTTPCHSILHTPWQSLLHSPSLMLAR